MFGIVLGGIYIVIGGEFHFVFVLVQNIRVVELGAKVADHALNILFAQFCLLLFFFGGKSDGFCFFFQLVYSFDIENIMPPVSCASLWAFRRVF